MNLSEQTKLAHRMGSKTLSILKADGTPLKNAEVTVAQTKHKFLFGGAEFSSIPFANGELLGEDENIAKDVFKKFFDLFNYTTIPFYWEKSKPEEVAAEESHLKKTAQWFQSNHCTVKGHPLCWHTLFPPNMLEMTNPQILDEQLKHIKHLICSFQGIIDIWDVINEPVIMPVFDKYDNGITRIAKEMGRFPLIRELFSCAKEADSHLTLSINDFVCTNIDSYEILLEGCLELGIPIDVIGIQSHMHQGYWGVEKTLHILERFSKFHLPIHFTECTFVSGHYMPKEVVDFNDYIIDKWPSTPEGEERQANEAALFYQVLFEHPSVESITWWEFVDGHWLGAPGGMITKEGRIKPIYEKMLKLIKYDWWTGSRQYIADEQGKIQVSGFYGDYEVMYKGMKKFFSIEESNEHIEGSVIL